MKTTTINKTKPGELIRLFPSETAPVWVRGHYCRSSKRYSLTRYDDANAETFRRGATHCITGFTF